MKIGEEMKIQKLKSDIAILRKSLMNRDRHLMIMAEALSEIKATSDGHSDQPIADIISGCLGEIQALEG
jgi:hypothetical protein